MLRNTLLAVLLLSGGSCADTPSSVERQAATTATEQQAAGEHPQRMEQPLPPSVLGTPVVGPPAAGSTPPPGSTMAELEASGPMRLRPCTTLSGDEYVACMRENELAISAMQADRKTDR